MNKNKLDLYIIGAGVSGLIAAKVLEDHGYAPIIIEATERAGGRLKTDVVGGYQLDRGFQVLLTAYPAAQKYLDYDKLDLQKITPGAVVFKEKKKKIIGDPSRDLKLLIATLTSGVGSLLDKIKILKLSRYLRRKKLDDIFSEEEQSTLSYLVDFGFSEGMINDFFKPFFSGIFLESKLDTSSRMFEFIFKMFEEGYAAIPKNGIEDIPKQICHGLNETKFIYNSRVVSLIDNQITLDDGRVFKSDYTIIANEGNSLINDKTECLWKSCDNFYFTTKGSVIKSKLIGLIPAKKSFINNIFYHTSLETSISSTSNLLSVTVINNKNLSEAMLLDQVVQELKDYCGIEDVCFLKNYRINKALPIITDNKYDVECVDSFSGNSVFFAGDQQLNPSLNAAILSGEAAAMAVIDALENFHGSN